MSRTSENKNAMTTLLNYKISSINEIGNIFGFYYDQDQILNQFCFNCLSLNINPVITSYDSNSKKIYCNNLDILSDIINYIKQYPNICLNCEICANIINIFLKNKIKIIIQKKRLFFIFILHKFLYQDLCKYICNFV